MRLRPISLTSLRIREMEVLLWWPRLACFSCWKNMPPTLFCYDWKELENKKCPCGTLRTRIKKRQAVGVFNRVRPLGFSPYRSSTGFAFISLLLIHMLNHLRILDARKAVYVLGRTIKKLTFVRFCIKSSRVTKYNCSLRSNSTKCSRPRLTVATRQRSGSDHVFKISTQVLFLNTWSAH